MLHDAAQHAKHHAKRACESLAEVVLPPDFAAWLLLSRQIQRSRSLYRQDRKEQVWEDVEKRVTSLSPFEAHKIMEEFH